jgi:hypothetical protein
VKVLVTGDRFWDDYETILGELEKLPSGSIVVHGACRGADTIAGEIAKALGHEVRPYPADWVRYRRGAGPVRNRQMLREENLPDEPIDLVLGFHKNIKESKGTKDMLSISDAAGVQTRLVVG